MPDCWRRLFDAEWRLLQTPLRPEECAARLRARRATSLVARFDPTTVWGTISAAGFSLHRSRGYRNRNPVQRVVSGQFVAGPQGSQALVCLAYNRAGWVLALPGLVVLLLFCLQRLTPGDPPLLPVVAVVVALAFTALMLGLGYWLARDDDEFLIGFVCDALSASVLCSPPEIAGGRESLAVPAEPQPRLPSG
jgi:hypothetical protein